MSVSTIFGLTMMRRGIAPTKVDTLLDAVMMNDRNVLFILYMLVGIILYLTSPADHFLFVIFIGFALYFRFRELLMEPGPGRLLILMTYGGMITGVYLALTSVYSDLSEKSTAGLQIKLGEQVHSAILMRSLEKGMLLRIPDTNEIVLRGWQGFEEFRFVRPPVDTRLRVCAYLEHWIGKNTSSSFKWC